jgi:hypothetical protein
MLRQRARDSIKIGQVWLANIESLDAYLKASARQTVSTAAFTSVTDT